MRILITGGSGFLGRALTRHWRDEHVVCCYSRSESAQAALEPHPNVRKFLGDVRDRNRLRRAMDGCDVVVHAAALKRIENGIGAYNPLEMVRTNIGGTDNVIEAAQDAWVDRVVFVSTDKAWRPVSLYGLTKATAEEMILQANNTVQHGRGPRFAVCRYGNVMGSTGSVVPIWRAAAARGERVRLTDHHVTRFWMDINEAVMLIAGAVASMQGGERYIPRLPAFRLGDLAQAMGVVYDVVGLPAWEKMHEGLDDDQTSDQARRMSVDEIRERLKGV